MNVSLYQAAAAMNASSQWEDIVSENLAASSVPGYRKKTLATEAVQAGLVSGNTGTAKHFNIPESRVVTSFAPGETNFTGDNRDVALDGTGFFQVKLANGDEAVTRDGEFRTNSKGQLVSKEGYVVMSDNNNPIQLDPTSHDEVSINPGGQVLQGGVVKGKLGITDFENPELLTNTNGVYFLTDNPALKTKASTAAVKDGFVEGANTSSLNEMANLLTSMRSFEANTKVIQMQDDRMNKTITDLGTPAQG